MELDIVGGFGIENCKYIRINIIDSTSILITSLMHHNFLELLKYFDEISIKFVNKVLHKLIITMKIKLKTIIGVQKEYIVA